MKVAIIGFGVIGRVHAEIADALGARVVVCDNAERARDEAASAYPSAAIYADWRETILTERPDIVHICTPHCLHAGMSVFALTAGSHVLCEKPMCISRAEIDAIRDAVGRSGKQFGVCQQNRYNASVRFLKRYLEGKRPTGAYATVAWERDRAYYASGDWRGKRASEGGGVLINQALHTLDLVEWLIGMPRFVTAQVGNFHLRDAIEVEDTAALFLTGGGCPVSLYATTAAGANFPVRISVFADGKMLELLPSSVLEDGKTIFSDPPQKVYAKTCYGCGHSTLISDFYDCVATGRRFPIGVDEAECVVRTILAAYESNGCAIAL